MSDPEPMDVDKVLEKLNAGLELQLRSLLQFTQASGSMFGLEVQGVAAKLGDPTAKVGKLSWDPNPASALDHLMEHIIMRKQNQVDWLRRARRDP